MSEGANLSPGSNGARSSSQRTGNVQIHGCTIAAVNSLPQAAVLAESFRKWHPNSLFVTLVLGAFELQQPDVWTLNDLGLSPADADRLPKIYKAPEELALALKPVLLERLLANGSACAIYLDPHIEVLAPLDPPLLEFVQENGTILTARCNLPANCEAVADTAERFRREPGFVAVGRKSEPFLAWWKSRVQDDVEAHRSLDRAVLDRIPDDICVHVIDEPVWNAGYWNLDGRELALSETSYELSGETVRLFNFTGYETERPHLLSKHQGHNPNVLLSESPALEKLCREYRDKVLTAVSAQTQRHPDGFGYLPSGLAIDRHIHQLYADALARYHSDAGPAPVDPHAAEPAFVKWLNQRMMEGKPDITRYMLAVHAARPDLQAAFPEPLGRDATAFHTWFITCGSAEENVPRELMPSDVRDTISRVSSGIAIVTPAASTGTVEIVGYFRAELGNGETARLFVSAFEAAGIPFITTVYDRTSSRQSHAFAPRTATTSPDVELLCINADQLPAYAATRRADVRQQQYRIGLWFWEVDEFPERFDAAFDLVDEVWVTSEYVGRTLRKVSPKPVVKVVMPVVKPPVTADVNRSSFGLSDRFCFLFNFDFLSVLERKNAVGLVSAFTRAFRPGEGPILVIKSINGDQRVLESERLKYAAAGHPDIRLIDGYLSAVENNALTAVCDCYVSLHRSEGFGQTIAEAMALGKPAIATAYSGNLEFMTPENSYLCCYDEREVGPGCEPYPATAHWAEPDLDHAAELMRHVYEHQDEARARGARAAQDIERFHSPTVAGRIIRDRLCVIQHHRNRAAERHAQADPAEAQQAAGAS